MLDFIVMRIYIIVDAFIDWFWRKVRAIQSDVLEGTWGDKNRSLLAILKLLFFLFSKPDYIEIYI